MGLMSQMSEAAPNTWASFEEMVMQMVIIWVLGLTFGLLVSICATHNLDRTVYAILMLIFLNSPVSKSSYFKLNAASTATLGTARARYKDATHVYPNRHLDSPSFAHYARGVDFQVSATQPQQRENRSSHPPRSLFLSLISYCNII